MLLHLRIDCAPELCASRFPGDRLACEESSSLSRRIDVDFPTSNNHVSLKAVARVISLVSPYAPASASIMYPPNGRITPPCGNPMCGRQASCTATPLCLSSRRCWAAVEIELLFADAVLEWRPITS